MNMESPKITSQQSAPAAPRHRKYLHNRYIVPAILILLVLLGGAYLLWQHYHSSNSYPYTYKKTHAYSLPGSQPGRGISFDKPDALGAAAPNENTATQRGFEQVLIPLDKNKAAVIYSRLLVESSDYAKGPSANLVKLINDAAKTPSSDSGYQGVVRNAQTFTVKAFQQSGVKYDYSHAQPFASQYVKANAWQFDVTATGKDPKNFPEQQGKLLFLVGKHTAYYFFIAAIKDNWQSNHAFFDQVVNSVKIDQ
jgi:hypothetical protein